MNIRYWKKSILLWLGMLLLIYGLVADVFGTTSELLFLVFTYVGALIIITLGLVYYYLFNVRITNDTYVMVATFCWSIALFTMSSILVISLHPPTEIFISKLLFHPIYLALLVWSQIAVVPLIMARIVLEDVD